MGGLFGPAVGPAPASDAIQQLGRALPAHLRMGTSSWTFPGWTGTVWDRGVSDAILVSEGLAAYAQHPLLRTVGIDRTFYGPVDRVTYRQWAESVPETFRFMVKAHEHITTARFSKHPRYGALAGTQNSRFLDPGYATDAVVGPTVEGLGDRLGTILFQFPPTDPRVLGEPEALADRLDRFFSALPVGPSYAVELRTREWMTEAYAQVLLKHQVRHSYVVHPSMPSIGEQIRRVRGGARAGLLIRWMLHSGWTYAQAVDAFRPFTERRSPDPRTQTEIAKLIGLALGRDKEVLVIINNKAEGSAPWSIIELGRAIRRLEGGHQHKSSLPAGPS